MTEQSYFKDAHGKHTFPGQHPRHRCEGSEDCITPTRLYLVSFDNEPAILVNYCLQCADLAAANYPGNVTSIEPSREVILETTDVTYKPNYRVDDWRLWDDGQIEVSRGGSWEAPHAASPVPQEILELAKEVDLKLWGRTWMWSETTPHASEVLPFRNLLTFAYIWEREEDGHTYWRTNDGWMAAPTLTNGNPDWDAAGYVSDFIISEEEKKELNEWLQEKP
jgi:hypothetical protein